MARQRPWASLVLFFLVLAAASDGLEWRLISLHEPIERHLALALALMWVPAGASVVARLAFREGFKDISLRFGGWAGARETVRAWIFPVVVGGGAYGVAWASGLAGFQIHRAMFLGPPSSPVDSLLRLLAVQSTVNTLINAIAAAGEEIGWRGFLLTRLMELGAS